MKNRWSLLPILAILATNGIGLVYQSPKLGRLPASLSSVKIPKSSDLLFPQKVDRFVDKDLKNIVAKLSSAAVKLVSDHDETDSELHLNSLKRDAAQLDKKVDSLVDLLNKVKKRRSLSDERKDLIVDQIEELNDIRKLNLSKIYDEAIKQFKNSDNTDGNNDEEAICKNFQEYQNQMNKVRKNIGQAQDQLVQMVESLDDYKNDLKEDRERLIEERIDEALESYEERSYAKESIFDRAAPYFLAQSGNFDFSQIFQNRYTPQNQFRFGSSDNFAGHNSSGNFSGYKRSFFFGAQNSSFPSLLAPSPFEQSGFESTADQTKSYLDQGFTRIVPTYERLPIQSPEGFSF